MFALPQFPLHLRPALRLEEIFAREMQHLHSAESQRFTVLPAMAAAATLPPLRAWLEMQCEQAVLQLQRLEAAAELLDDGLEGRSNPTMRSLVAEAYGRCALASGLRDAGLLCTAVKMAHYEVAGWASGCRYARLLGRPRMLEPFQGAVRSAAAALGQLAVLQRTLPLRLAPFSAPRPRAVRGSGVVTAGFPAKL